MTTFKEHFKFDPEKTLYVGIERERFLTTGGHVAPLAPKVLEKLKSYGDRFGYELSACQLEDRIGPCSIDEAENALIENDRAIATAEINAKGAFTARFMKSAQRTCPWMSTPIRADDISKSSVAYPATCCLLHAASRERTCISACLITIQRSRYTMPSFPTAQRFAKKETAPSVTAWLSTASWRRITNHSCIKLGNISRIPP